MYIVLPNGPEYEANPIVRSMLQLYGDTGGLIINGLMVLAILTIFYLKKLKTALLVSNIMLAGMAIFGLVGLIWSTLI